MTTRRKRIAVRSGAALALLLVIALVICSIKPARDITIIGGGNPNQRLAAQFVADGNVVFERTSTLPIKQSFEANEFSYWLLPDNEMNNSEITLQILVNDVPLWSPNKPNCFASIEGCIDSESTALIRASERHPERAFPSSVSCGGEIDLRT